jgi:hypothetical protein
MLPFALAESSLPAPNSDPLYQEIQQDCRNPGSAGNEMLRGKNAARRPWRFTFGLRSGHFYCGMTIALDFVDLFNKTT